MQRQAEANDGRTSRLGAAVLDRDVSEAREEAKSGLKHGAGGATSEARTLLFDRASWTLVDQCVVSLGNFALNVQLARDLAVADYGKFALFLGAIFALRCFDYSLISYPLSVRLHSAHHDEHAGLMANSALLAGVLGLVLLLVLALGIQLLGGGDILLPAASCYLAWQAQETTRRCLLANFRYRAAVAGDAVSFIGQAVAIAMLAWVGWLTLSTSIYAMSATFVAGALVHASKLHFGRPNVSEAMKLARDYFALGKWSLVYYEVVILRLQLFPWVLAATVGTAATAAFQAAANIANVMNPISLGIGNVIPQAAAHAHVTGGVHGAWRSARGYILFGLPPILVICAAGLVAPQVLLRLMYGASSAYLDAGLAVQLLVVALAAEYVGEMIGKTLLGVGAGRLASLVIAFGLAAAVLSLPLIMLFGVVGAALGLAITNLIRLLVAWVALRWLIAKETATPNLGERGGSMSKTLHTLVLTCWGMLCAGVLSGSALAASTLAPQGTVNELCPSGAIAVAPGSSIQAAVDEAGPNAAFCLKNGVHRMQVVRPLDSQSFYGEGGTILNGSRLLTEFTREGDSWVANGQTQHGQKHGECLKTAPACDLPEAVFIDDKPLAQVLSKDGVKPGSFYFDYAGDRIYLSDDPAGHKVEATVGAFAFESLASNVLIKNLIIEKYANPAQKGAVYSLGTTGWSVENSELRLNSGAGIVIGNGAKVLASNLHHNGQTGIAGEGNGVLIANNLISANNIYGFDYKWEAGGVKLATSDGVVMRGNRVYDNIGPGLWCDIGCRNVLYENNIVERNHDAGIFHEISFNAVIRNNTAGNNGLEADPDWFWGADILLSASQDVEVTGNRLTVRPGGCGIMLIDQGRTTDSGGQYKTRDNKVHQNDLTFDGAPCAGGISDTAPDNANYLIITDGNNLFDANVYRARTSKAERFPWGHQVYNWDGLRAAGLEPNGQLMFY